ncbi:hypothetical protein [Ornithinimicrobium kibberense]|uniref:hypothetical protein n=1 Tax=Ornithinimicrobium kibberense TaxID=282060 RepID=UPI00362000CE
MGKGWVIPPSASAATMSGWMPKSAKVRSSCKGLFRSVGAVRTRGYAVGGSYGADRVCPWGSGDAPDESNRARHGRPVTGPTSPG